MESRKGHSSSRHRKSGKSRSGGGLPHDFLEMVNEVFSTNFDSPLKKLAAMKGGAAFKSSGEVFPDEIILAVSIVHPGALAATTVHASVDFDPKASSPNAQDLLSACVDALGGVFGALLVDEKDKLEQIADESLSALEDVPFEWTKVDVEKFKIYVKIDKSNPDLDAMADDWLAKNDPNAQDEDESEQKATENLFVTGPKSPLSAQGKKRGKGRGEGEGEGNDEGGGGQTLH